MYFWSKAPKMTVITEFCILELVLLPNSTLNKQFWVLGPNLPKKCISHPNKKNRTFAFVLGRYLLC